MGQEKTLQIAVTGFIQRDTNYWRHDVSHGYLHECQPEWTIHITMVENIGEADIRALLSRNLKRLRAKKKLSQLNLSIKAGLTHNFINDIENGKKWLSPKTLAALAVALDTSPHEFFVPEMVLPGRDVALLTGHLNNFADDILQWVEDIKGRYLQSFDENE